MKRWVLLVMRLGLGAIFIWSASTKIHDLQAFAEEVANYQLLPPTFAPWFAAMLPGVELLCGALLIVGVWPRANAVVLGTSLLMFIVALSQALARGIDLRCGCFGGADVATWGTVARDAVMIIPAAAIVWLAKEE